MLTYVAPWLPDDNLYCSMGYDMLLKRKEVSAAELLLGLRCPDLAAQPLPWKASPEARREQKSLEHRGDSLRGAQAMRALPDPGEARVSQHLRELP